MGELKFFLGIEIIKCDFGLCLCQRKYTLELLHEYGMLSCKPADTPFDLSTVVSNVGIDKSDDLISDFTGYPKLIGKLIYLTITRPDISFAIQSLSKFMHAPRKSHVKLSFRVLKYLKSSPGQGISVVKTVNNSLVGFVDADWGRCFSTRRSITGFCLFLGETLVSSKSKKQPTVSRSSTESEYRALAVVTCEVLWIVKLLIDLHVKCEFPVGLYCDNNSAIQLTLNPVFHERTKHIEIDVHFVRDKVMEGVVRVEKVGTNDQTADIFTKPLKGSRHNFLCSKLKLFDPFKNKIEGGT